MAKYMYLFRGTPKTPEEMEVHMDKWRKWISYLAEEGKLVGQNPLGKEGKQVFNAGKVIHDGPYIEGKEIIGGYLIVDAENIDEAVEISKECPIFGHDGLVEVREILEMEL